MKKLIAIFPVFFLSFWSCQMSETVAPGEADIVQLKSGQSFGMCMGVCFNEMIIDTEKITLKQVDYLERGGNTKEYEHVEKGAAIKSAAIFQKISQPKFLSLKEVYGCPDCADGGREWLEITFKNGKTKRVEFEYGSVLDGFEEITKQLREERLSLIEKYR